MNNQQFRRLVLDTPSNASNAVGTTPRRDGAAPLTLGSRMRSSIYMTPRSVTGSSGVDFARQLRERDAPASSTKKFRSSAVPKGSKLAAGYQDRTRFRTSVEDDDKASRVKALEEMVKLGQMEQATFEALRDEIVGGDVKAAHLVKGLDYKLLERVRRGEDVLAENIQSEKQEDKLAKEEDNIDVEEEFAELEEKEIIPLAKEEKVKKGDMAPPPAIAGKKRTRDEILRELKASRLKAVEDKKAAEQILGPKFKKVGTKREESRIERDDRGREVLITVDENGKVKRKVRKSRAEEVELNGNGLLMPDKDVKPLGMDVPEIQAPKMAPEEDDGDIFEGAGVDYDPLGALSDEDDSAGSDCDTQALNKESEPHENNEDRPATLSACSPEHTHHSPKPPSEMLPPPAPAGLTPTRNYFNTSSTTETETPGLPANPLTDPSILAALKKASTISTPTSQTHDDHDTDAAKAARHAKLLSSHDRDADDMDLGFGSSRLEDEEDFEEKKVKLSIWGGEADAEAGKKVRGKRKGGDDDGNGRERKRGGKKRKGDKNSAIDVLGVMERRKGEGKK